MRRGLRGAASGGGAGGGGGERARGLPGIPPHPRPGVRPGRAPGPVRLQCAGKPRYACAVPRADWRRGTWRRCGLGAGLLAGGTAARMACADLDPSYRGLFDVEVPYTS